MRFAVRRAGRTNNSGHFECCCRHHMRRHACVTRGGFLNIAVRGGDVFGEVTTLGCIAACLGHRSGRHTPVLPPSRPAWPVLFRVWRSCLAWRGQSGGGDCRRATHALYVHVGVVRLCRGGECLDLLPFSSKARGAGPIREAIRQSCGALDLPPGWQVEGYVGQSGLAELHRTVSGRCVDLALKSTWRSR